MCERWAGRGGNRLWGPLGPITPSTSFGDSQGPDAHVSLAVPYLNPVQRASGTRVRPLRPAGLVGFVALAVPFQDLNRRVGRVTLPSLSFPICQRRKIKVTLQSSFRDRKQPAVAVSTRSLLWGHWGSRALLPHVGDTSVASQARWGWVSGCGQRPAGGGSLRVRPGAPRPPVAQESSCACPSCSHHCPRSPWVKPVCPQHATLCGSLWLQESPPTLTVHSIRSRPVGKRPPHAHPRLWSELGPHEALLPVPAP